MNKLDDVVYVCSTSMEEWMDFYQPLSSTDEWGNAPYTMMRNEEATGKAPGMAPGLIELVEWEQQGFIERHLCHTFEDPISGYAFAAYCEEQLQLKAAWERTLPSG